jgi:hypothetical protein
MQLGPEWLPSGSHARRWIGHIECGSAPGALRYSRPLGVVVTLAGLAFVQAGWGAPRIFRLDSHRPILGLWVRLPGCASGTTGLAGS